MKFKRSHLFVAISSLALVIVLIIQVNWIFQTARIKEAFFNEKANIVLARTVEAISSDKETSKKIEACLALNSPAQLGKDEVRKIDSLLMHYMRYYNFNIDYSFEVVKPVFTVLNNNPADSFDTLTNTPNQKEVACYQISIDKVVNKNGFELKLFFPNKAQFIRAEMGTVFITSVVLILVVLALFWRSILLLTKEKQLSEHTTDFLNNMTHEFKTPLTNIALAGKMMVKDSNLKQEGKIKHYSGIIQAENEKLRLQVEQVLSMTALERGEIPLQKTELDLHQLIKDATKAIGIQIENKQGNLNLNLDAEKFVIMGDRTHLTNALCNLIDNAVKYSKGKPELSIQTFNSSENIIIIVADNGIGIEKEYQKKVFDKFFRVPTGDVHDVKGFGLGLAYIKKIVELHDGTIELASEKAKGTSFTITLPNV